MGNSCFGDNIHIFKEVNLNACSKKQDINLRSDRILSKDEEKINPNEKHKEKNKKKTKNKMNELFNYFSESEKEIMNNLKKKDKSKRIPTKKRQDYTIDNKDNNKYELMLKRLLEQKNVKKNGPKRRETLRKDNGNIKEMIKDILTENKNEILNNKNQRPDPEDSGKLLISKPNNSRGRLSAILDRNTLFKNNLNKKNYIFQDRKTFCAVLAEANGVDKKKNNLKNK